jgi:lipopolysaccharide transport system ATP-binding protein
LTGRENVFLNGAILGMTRAEVRKKFDEIVAFAEVDQFIDTPVKRYSSGMYVRLAFAVAAHLEPEILIVDEVLAVGDASFQKKCLGKMQDVTRNEGRTVVFVSHQMNAVTALCPRCILLSQGSLECIDETASVVSRYFAYQRQSRVESITSLRMPGMRKGAEFTSIAWDCGESVPFGSDLVFRLNLRSNRRLTGLSIGASVFQTAGDCVGTLFTAETFDLAAGQEKQLRLVVTGSNIAPGDYYAGFSIGAGNHYTLRVDEDIVIGLPAFRISHLGPDAKIIHWHANWGTHYLSQTRLDELPLEMS